MEPITQWAYFSFALGLGGVLVVALTALIQRGKQ